MNVESVEYFDVFDQNRNLIGKKVKRGDSYSDNEFHLIVHVWVKLKDDKFILSKRKMTKKPYPGLWEATGGSVLAGETSLNAAIREVNEELGIDLSKTNGKLIYQFKGNNNYSPHFIDVWLFSLIDNNVNIICQESEVEEAKIIGKTEIKEFIKNNEIVPDCISYIKILFEEK